MPRFYRYSENNSGGYYTGEHQYIFIEAESASEADSIAVEECGIYFAGVYAGRDCSCCGDRWRTANEYDSGSEEEAIEECLIYQYPPSSVRFVYKRSTAS